MATGQYVIIPDTQQKVYKGSVVVLYRLPDLRWVLYYGPYDYLGTRRRGWYFSEITKGTVIPVTDRDLVRLKVIHSPKPGVLPPAPPPGPLPPEPEPVPEPEPSPVVPVPAPFTRDDKKRLKQAMLTVPDMNGLHELEDDSLIDGKVVRVNDIDGQGTVGYYSWNKKAKEWEYGPFSEKYPAILLDSLLASISVGGVDSGTAYERGTLLETIVRDMLSPTLYPTLTDPRLIISPSSSTLLEKGTSKIETITAQFSRGSIDPAYGTDGYRSGPVETYCINNGDPQTSNIFTVALDQTHNTFIGTANYTEGPQPKDSSGQDYDYPLPAGSINSSVLTYEFVNAIWANETSAETISKCELVSFSAKQKVFVFPNCSIANPEVFDVPASWSITAIEVKNDLNNLFEDCSVEFTASDITHSDAGGNSVAYTRYTCNLGYDMASRTIRIKWS